MKRILFCLFFQALFIVVSCSPNKNKVDVQLLGIVKSEYMGINYYTYTICLQNNKKETVYLPVLDGYLSAIKIEGNDGFVSFNDNWSSPSFRAIPVGRSDTLKFTTQRKCSSVKLLVKQKNEKTLELVVEKNK